MKLAESKVRKIAISDVKRLDLVNVIVDDIAKGRGRIIIECYGKSWTSYWGAIGEENTIAEFFCTCNNDYLVNNLAPNMKHEVYDVLKIKEDAKKRDIECWRDDPWHDYEFMNEMYGADMSDWDDLLPKEINHEYAYLCRIIDAVKGAFLKIQEENQKHSPKEK